MKNAIKTAIDAIKTAIAGWDGADWTHNVGRTDIICDGTWDCAICGYAEADAAKAQSLGSEAIKALSYNDIDEADVCCAEAAALEARWGDCPA